jgi:hypothetical protein
MELVTKIRKIEDGIGISFVIPKQFAIEHNLYIDDVAKLHFVKVGTKCKIIVEFVKK